MSTLRAVLVGRAQWETNRVTLREESTSKLGRIIDRAALLPRPQLDQHECHSKGRETSELGGTISSLKNRLPAHVPFSIAQSLITNGTATVLVSHHWQVEWPASITAWSTRSKYASPTPSQ
jgi:hypothetical protein